MIRQPTSPDVAYRWWNGAIAGRTPDRVVDDPEPGWFKMRAAKRGTWVPAVIWINSVTDPDTGELTEPETLVAEVEREPADPVAIWPYVEPISAAEFEALSDYWAKNQWRFNPKTQFDPLQPVLPR